MFKNLVGFILVSLAAIGFVMPTMAQEEEEEAGPKYEAKISGYVEAYMNLMGEVADNKDDETTEIRQDVYDGVVYFNFQMDYTDTDKSAWARMRVYNSGKRRYYVSATHTDGDWTANAYGQWNEAFVNGNVDVYKYDHYVSLENAAVKFKLGYDNHLDVAYQGIDYLVGDIDPTNWGMHGRFNALTVGLKGLGEGVDFNILLALDQDSKLLGAVSTCGVPTNDTTFGIFGGYSADNLDIGFNYGSATAEGDEDRADSTTDAAIAADYKLEATNLSFGVKFTAGTAGIFFDYTMATAKDQNAKTGDGFTEMILGADLDLGDGLGLTVLYDSFASDPEDSATRKAYDYLVAGVAKDIASVTLEGSMKTVIGSGDATEGMKDTLYEFGMQYSF